MNNLAGASQGLEHEKSNKDVYSMTVWSAVQQNQKSPIEAEQIFNWF